MAARQALRQGSTGDVHADTGLATPPRKSAVRGHESAAQNTTRGAAACIFRPASECKANLGGGFCPSSYTLVRDSSKNAPAPPPLQHFVCRSHDRPRALRYTPCCTPLSPGAHLLLMLPIETQCLAESDPSPVCFLGADSQGLGDSKLITR